MRALRISYEKYVTYFNRMCDFLGDNNPEKTEEIKKRVIKKYF